jgi:hypothetical protein
MFEAGFSTPLALSGFLSATGGAFPPFLFFAALYSSFLSMKGWSDLGCLPPPTSSSTRKQCKIAVAENEKTERKIEERMYAIATTITIGNTGE